MLWYTALNEAESPVNTWLQVLGSYFVVLGRRYLDGKPGTSLAPSLRVRNKAALLLTLSKHSVHMNNTNEYTGFIGKPVQGYNVFRPFHTYFFTVACGIIGLHK